MFTLSAFGDEIASDLRTQVQLLQQLNVGYLEFRAAWGTNVLHMSNDEVAEVKRICAEHDVAVSCIGSPIGKSPIMDPIENELSNLTRIMEIGDMLNTKRVRIFSFYPPDISTNAHYDDYVDEAVARLTQLAERAESRGFTLMLENEKEIVGDTVARCHALMSAIDNPHIRMAWDPANFVQVGEAQVTDRGWPILGEEVGYIHIKDAMLADGSVRAAGEGDGQVEELLTILRDSGYEGILALEPHLAIAGHSSGFSGVDGMTYAVNALRKLMAKVGCEESR